MQLRGVERYHGKSRELALWHQMRYLLLTRPIGFVTRKVRFYPILLVRVEFSTLINNLWNVFFKTHLSLLVIPHIECTPKDDDVCLTESPGWASNRDCAYAKSYCDSWAKDTMRCCPQTCGSGLLTVEQCENLDSKGTCIYPRKSQCPNEGIRNDIGVFYSYSFTYSWL